MSMAYALDRRRAALWAVTAAGAAAMLVAAWSYYDQVERHYLLFHSLIEMFSVAVAAAIFMIAWNSRRIAGSGYFLVLGVSYLFVGAIDVLHVLAFERMGVFDTTGADLATQLWIAGRYMEAVSIALAFAFIGRRVRAGWLMGACAAAFGGALLTIFVWPVFPTCYVAGRQPPLTVFKVASEFVIVAILAAALALLWWRREAFSRRVWWWLGGSIVATMASELVFTLYASPTDFWNMFGHLLKFASFVLIYKALVATGLREPYEVLFRDLKESESRLAAARDELARRYRQSEATLDRALVELEGEVRDRLDAEEAMWATDARYRSLVENIPAVTYTGALDADSTTLFVSPQVESILGFTPEEFAEPDAWTNCIHPEDRDRVLTAVRRATETGAGISTEYRMFARDGREVWVHDEADVVRDRLGTPLCLQGVMFDITELKRVEQVLRDSERHLERRVADRTADLAAANAELRAHIAARRRIERVRDRMATIIEATTDFVSSADADGHIIYLNKAARRIVGLGENEDLSDLTIAEFHPAWATKVVLEEGIPTARNGGVWRGETALRTRDGREIPVSQVIVAHRDPDGEVDYCSTIIRDISEHKAAEARIRRLNEGLEQRVAERTAELERANSLLVEEAARREQAQEALQRERQRLFTVLNVLPGYVMLVGRDCRVRFANHTYMDLFGQPGETQCHRMQFERHEQCEDCPINEVLDTRRPHNWEWRSGRNGRTYHVWAYPFADVDGSEAVLQLGVDVTDRKALERQVIETSEAERRSIGRDLHDTLGQNLTGVALLIKGLMDRLADVSPSDAATAEQLIELVNDAVGQVRSLARGLDPAGLDEGGLTGALEELADTTERVFKVPCELRCPEEISIQGAAATTHLYHIAREAVNNAVKHARARRIHLTIRSDPGSVSLIVDDDGVGIGELLRTSRGMGLRIMEYRASVLGAQLSVRPGRDGGTVVTVEVPVDQAVLKE